MKQVDIRNKEELDKESFQVHYSTNSPHKARQSTSFKRRSSLAAEARVRSHRRITDVGRAHYHGMANKENELTCSDEVRANCGLQVNSAAASKMAEASSKYSDFTELSKDHEALTHVLFGRNLRLKVAQTLWRRNASEFVAYIIRIQDTGVLLDCLPVLTNDLQTEAPGLSLGCCVDLIPQVKVILASKYEEHVMVGLHWVQTIIKKWWQELSKKEKRLQDSCSEDRNIEVMKQRLKDLWKEGAHICLVPGSTGELAKSIEISLSQLP